MKVEKLIEILKEYDKDIEIDFMLQNGERYNIDLFYKIGSHITLSLRKD